MPECRRCGGFVTRDFARVFGDNADRVHGCPACLSTRMLTEGVHEPATAGDGRTN